jgi:hypothetical protein
LVLISAGNAAYSLAAYAEGTGIDVVPVIDKTLSPEMRAAVRSFAPKTIEADLGEHVLTSDDLIAMARQHPEEKIWEVSNGFHAAYREIVRELLDEPDVIVVPCGSGEAMIGVYEELQERGWKTKVQGVGSKHMDKLRTIYTPYRDRLDAMSKEGHTVLQYELLTEASIVDKAPQDVPSEPAASLVYGPLTKLWLDRVKKVLLVNSGKGDLLHRIRHHQPWPDCGHDPIEDNRMLEENETAAAQRYWNGFRG